MLKKFILVLLLLCGNHHSWASTPTTVFGVGSTFDSAKNDAFRKAIEIQIGTVIVSNFEVSRDKVIKNEILAYSAGYVDKFDIKSHIQVNGQYQLEVDVWVSTSKIANRILSSTPGGAPFNGAIIYEQQNTFLESKNRGNAVLETVLHQYPENTYTVKLVRANLVHDHNRNVYLDIHYNVVYNQNWLDSFRETLSLVSDTTGKHNNPAAVIMLLDKPNAIMEFNRWNFYPYNDHVTLNKIRRNFEFKRPVLSVKLVGGGRVERGECYSLPGHLFYNHETQFDGVAAVKLFSHTNFSGSTQLYFTNKNILNNITDVKLEVVRGRDCAPVI